MGPHGTQVAPELTAAIQEAEQLRDIIKDILSRFGPSGSGHSARVGQVQIAKWRRAAGLPPS